MTKEWENKKDKFIAVNVSKLTGNFLPGLLRKAEKIEVGDGMCVVQSFEPIPLYSACFSWAAVPHDSEGLNFHTT